MSYTRRNILALAATAIVGNPQLDRAKLAHGAGTAEYVEIKCPGTWQLSCCTATRAIICKHSNDHVYPVLKEVSLSNLGQEVELPVNKIISRISVTSQSAPFMSPDGRITLINRLTFPEYQGLIVAADGSQHRIVLDKTPLYVSWSPDGDIVYLFTKHGPFSIDTVTSYRTDNGKLLAKYNIAVTTALSGTYDCFGTVDMPCRGPIINDRAYAISNRGPLTLRARGDSGGPVKLVTCDLKHTDFFVTETAIAIPSGSVVLEAVVSPDCLNVIWQLGFKQTTELWISDISGNGFRRIVSTPYHHDPDSNIWEHAFKDLMWVHGRNAVAWRVASLHAIRVIKI